MVEIVIQPDQRTDAAPSPGSNRLRIWTMFVACLGVSLVIASMVALNTALGDIAVATSATQTQLTWVVDCYSVVLACLLLPAGAIGDRYGRREAFLFGLAIFALASLASTVFTSPLELIAARGAAGAGAAFIMPATLSLLTATHADDKRAKAAGIWAGVAGCGAVIGMLGSGLLLHFWSWRSIFWAFAAGAVVIFALACTVSSSRDEKATPLDWPGAALIAGAVAIFVFGVLEAPTRSWGHPWVYGSMAGGVTLAVAFGFVEVRRRHPLLDVRLFRRPDFAAGSATITIFFLAMFGFFFVIMQYIQLVMGYSPIQTALALAPLMVPMLTLSVLSQWYLPRMGLRLVVFIGLLLISAGFLGMRGMHLHSAYWDMMWPLIVMSTGIGFCTAPSTTAIMAAAPDEKQGVASAVNDTTREVGAALGIALAGSILAARYGHIITPHLATFPGPMRAPASHSLAQALEIAKTIGPQGGQLAELSQTAFLQAMDSSLLVLGLVIAVSAFIVGGWAPGRDGKQLRPVRLLLSRRGHSRDELRGPVTEHDNRGVGSAAGDRREY